MIRCIYLSPDDKGVVDHRVSTDAMPFQALYGHRFPHIFIDLETRRIVSSRDELRMMVLLALHDIKIDVVS